MPVHAPPASTTTKSTTTTPTTTTSKGGKGQGGGYQSQTQHLTPPDGPGDGADGITIAGVWLSLSAVDATFAALDESKGTDWATKAHLAAKGGGSAVLKLVAPDLPLYAQRSPIVLDVLDKYARWATTPRPKVSTKPDKTKSQEAGKHHNLNFREYGLMVGLQEGVGTLIGGFCPAAGTSAGVDGKAAVSVEGVYLGVSFSLEAENGSDGQFSISGETEIAIGAGAVGDNICLTETLSVAGHGDDAVEAMHMVGLAIERWMRTQQFDWRHPTVGEAWDTVKKFAINTATVGAGAATALALGGGLFADALWGKDFERDIGKQMDEDDYGEQSIGVGGRMQGGVPDEVELEAGVKYQRKTEVRASDEGKVWDNADDVLMGYASLDVEAGNFTISGKGGFEISLQDMDELTLAFELGFGPKDGATTPELVGRAAAGIVTAMAQKCGKLDGWFGRMAKAVEDVMKMQEALDALMGKAGLELTAEYDFAKGTLDFTLIVKTTKSLGESNSEEELELDFWVGKEILSIPIQVGRP